MSCFWKKRVKIDRCVEYRSLKDQETFANKGLLHQSYTLKCVYRSWVELLHFVHLINWVTSLEQYSSFLLLISGCKQQHFSWDINIRSCIVRLQVKYRCTFARITTFSWLHIFTSSRHFDEMNYRASYMLHTLTERGSRWRHFFSVSALFKCRLTTTQTRLPGDTLPTRSAL